MQEQTLTIAGVQSGGVSRPEPEFIQIRDACVFSGMGRTSLYKEIGTGRIKSINLRKPGTARGRRLVHLPSLRAYLLSFAEAK